VAINEKLMSNHENGLEEAFIKKGNLKI